MFGSLPAGDEKDEWEYAVMLDGLWYVVTMDPTHRSRSKAMRGKEKMKGLVEVVSDWTKGEKTELDMEAMEVFGGEVSGAKVDEMEPRWLRVRG